MEKSDKYVKGKGGYVYGKPVVERTPIESLSGEVVIRKEDARLAEMIYRGFNREKP